MAPAKRHEKYGPNHPTRSGSSCNNAVGTRGGQLQYSDLAIETALTLRLIFHLPLRQTEGFLTSIFGMLGLELSAPEFPILSLNPGLRQRCVAPDVWPTLGVVA